MVSRQYGRVNIITVVPSPRRGVWLRLRLTHRCRRASGQAGSCD